MKGFTLMELILVMAIIAILSVIGFGSYTQATVKSRDTQRKSDLNQIAKAIELFNNDMGRYPNANEDGEMLCPGLTGSEDVCGQTLFSYNGAARMTYMDKFPTDPDPTLGRKYVYVPGENSRGFALYAALENGEDRDVVVDSNKDETDWGINCGTSKCNYKLTEVGLIRSK